MLIRALIVLLVILNLGVAAWWIGRPKPAAPLLPQQPAGIPILELVKAPAAIEKAASAAPLAQNRAESGSEPVKQDSSNSARCASLGPYAGQAAAQLALQGLQARSPGARLRELPAAGARSYRVLIPAVASREEAQAIGKRITQAGFKDFLVIGAGEEINSVALGVYGSLETALQRQKALQLAGFSPQLRAVGAKADSQWWLDVAVATPESLPQWQSLAGASQVQALDCAALR